MQFESLRVYCDVARHRSFSLAAAANKVSQSAVSQVVSHLEKRLGVLLVDRSHRPLRLTRQGQAYYEGCRRIVDDFLGMEATVRNLQTQIASKVQVAAIYSVGLRDMGQVVQRFGRGNPGVEVAIEYLHPDRVVEKVLEGAADLGLVSFPRASRKLATIPWREEEMVLTCPPTHPLVARRAVRLPQLEGARYVGFDKHLEIRRRVDRFLKDHGVSVEVAMEFDNIENIKKAVEVSAGVALLPLPTLRREIESGTLAAVPLADARLVRPLGIIHRRNPKPGAMTRRFIELLRQPDEPSFAARGSASEGKPHVAGGNGRGNGRRR